ncbi:hypothetical protein [Nitrosospira sp. NpAV]|uniref:hypothetical protein n=1 Tax=Nitrosospira sp. NpAV TaxID=58133 RepID=UPI0005A24557|nr:hypothetical protein [Nitrosospira sp. NpAV]KIO48755.1 hypothetical protein SQ11_09450 [Nitrosospira sp. NpAV]
MNTSIWEFVLALLGALGGGGLIVLGLSRWLGEVWSSRIAEKLRAANAHDLERTKAALLHEVESHKIRLKKSEFLFQKEFEAASSFSAVFRSLHPGFNHPNMDWYEACDEIAQRLGSIEKKLEHYFSAFSAVLTEEERNILSDAISDAGYWKFEVINGVVSCESSEAAGTLYLKLKDFDSKLIARIRDQASP